MPHCGAGSVAGLSQQSDSTFSTGSPDESVKRVQDLGGRLVAGPIDIEPGRFAALADPQGAVFNLMFLHAPDD